jgi:hypothetical protein
MHSGNRQAGPRDGAAQQSDAGRAAADDAAPRDAGGVKDGAGIDVEPAPPGADPPEPPSPPEPLPADVRSLLPRLAVPRLAGSESLGELQHLVADRLRELGYDVRRRTFDFSAAPGRYGLAAAGGVLGVGMLGATLALQRVEPVAALAVLGAAGVLVAALALSARRLTRSLGWQRIEGVNLEAAVPGEQPRFIVMAHLDSKSQLLPLALRAPAIGVAALGWLALVVLSLMTLAQPVGAAVITVVGAVGVFAALLVALSWVSDGSPGALDNASGVAALLMLAEREKQHGDVGFLVTDAEELGLQGARALAGSIPPVFGVINIDGLDDEGDFHVMERFGVQKKGFAPHIVVAFLTAAEEMGVRAHRRDLPPGVLVDHIPIVEGGQPAITLMRGGWNSMMRVHRAADAPEQLRGAGVETGVELVARALEHMRTQAARPDVR